MRTLISKRLGYVFGRCTLDKCKDKDFICCERPSSSGETWGGSKSPIHIVHKSERDDFLTWPDDALVRAEEQESEQNEQFCDSCGDEDAQEFEAENSVIYGYSTILGKVQSFSKPVRDLKELEYEELFNMGSDGRDIVSGKQILIRFPNNYGAYIYYDCKRKFWKVVIQQFRKNKCRTAYNNSFVEKDTGSVSCTKETEVVEVLSKIFRIFY